MIAKLNPSLFAGEPVSTTLYCACGAIWRAHAKLKRDGDSFVHEVSALCPVCGDQTDIRQTSSDPETVMLRRS